MDIIRTLGAADIADLKSQLASKRDQLAGHIAAEEREISAMELFIQSAAVLQGAEPVPNRPAMARESVSIIAPVLPKYDPNSVAFRPGLVSMNYTGERIRHSFPAPMADVVGPSVGTAANTELSMPDLPTVATSTEPESAAPVADAEPQVKTGVLAEVQQKIAAAKARTAVEESQIPPPIPLVPISRPVATPAKAKPAQEAKKPASASSVPQHVPQEPMVGLTMAQRAAVYLEANHEATTMALVSYLELPDGKSLERLLGSDTRFTRDSKVQWKLS